MKNLNPWIQLSLQFAYIFTVAILVSFIPDYLHTFFGDEWCTFNNCFRSDSTPHKYPEWHYGYRHWLWILMGIVLFFIQLARIIHFISRTEFE